MNEGTTDAPNKDLETTLESGDNYVNANGMLPRGGTLSRVQVIERRCNSYGNPIRRFNDNSILGLCHYLVEFECGEVIELN